MNLHYPSYPCQAWVVPLWLQLAQGMTMPIGGPRAASRRWAWLRRVWPAWVIPDVAGHFNPAAADTAARFCCRAAIFAS